MSNKIDYWGWFWSSRHFWYWNSSFVIVTLLLMESASRCIYVLKQLKRIDSVTKKGLLQVYQLFILSVLEYNSALFTGLTVDNENTLENLRKRCHHIICDQNCDCPDFHTLTDRRSLQILKVFNQMQNPHHILHHLLPHRLPRTQHFFIEYMRSEMRARSFIIPFCCTWSNFLPRLWFFLQLFYILFVSSVFCFNSVNDASLLSVTFDFHSKK